jgi:DNA-binding HxlR family transcriptional regulator
MKGYVAETDIDGSLLRRGRLKAKSGASDRWFPWGHPVSETKATANSRPENAAMLAKLDRFLDAQAEGHRAAMEQVVAWLRAHGDLEAQIRASVKALAGLQQKWSFEIMFLLRMRGTMRFNELKEELAGVAPQGVVGKVKELAGVGSRTLSERLKELETAGLVRRKAYAEVPVRVEYSLTPKGMRFGDLVMPVIAHLRIWDLTQHHDQS